MSQSLAERRLAALAEIARVARISDGPDEAVRAANEVLATFNLTVDGNDASADDDTRSFMNLVAGQLSASNGGNRLLSLVTASSAMLSSQNSPNTLVGVLEMAKRFVRADAYALWKPHDEEGRWTALTSSGLNESYPRDAQEAEPYRTVDDKALVFEDVLTEPSLERRWDRYRAEGVRSLIGIPVRIRGEVSGSLIFYYRIRRKFTDDDINLATALGNLAAVSIDIAELYAGQEEERRRATFLAKAGTVLAASLDVETTLNAIARLSVPAIADWCTVDLLLDGALRRVSVMHADPDRAAWARSLFDRNPIRGDSPLFRIIDGLRPLLIETIGEEHLRSMARSDDHLEGIRSVQLNSSIVVPLYARGEKFGALCLYRSHPTKPFTSTDVPLAEELGARAAIAIHSAKLHRAVAESAERLGISADAAGLGIFDMNLETGVVRWENDRIYEIFGRDPQQGPVLAEEFFRDFLHPDDREVFQRAGREGRFQIIGRIIRGDGEQRIVEFAGRVEASKRMIGVVADITERRRLEDRLREAAKLESIGLLAGGVAHDFNNLLTGIMGHSSLALEVLDHDHPAKPMVEHVLGAAEKAAVLTRQMLAYSGRGKFVLSQVDISELIREIEGLIGLTIPKNADVRLDLKDNLPPVHADPAEMQQLVMNLIINAAEALNGCPGAVRVRTGICDLDGDGIGRLPQMFEIRTGRYVLLEVEDEGCGMDATTLDRIFDPFFTTKFTGRGLGLSAVQGIVRGHKGSIDVQSEVGRGTTFRVYLPPEADL